MPGSYTLPNPASPASSDPLTSAPIRQNLQSLAAQINNADGAALQAKSVLEGALSDNANSRLTRTNAGVSYIVSGLNPSVPGAGLVITIPAGVGYVNGYFISYPGGTLTVLANKDTYVDIDQNSSISSVAVNNNLLTGMTPAVNTLRLMKVVANTNIVQVLQNTFNTAPVSPNTLNWFGFDPLGNAVYNTAPTNPILGYAQTTASFSSSSGTIVAVTGLSVNINVPAGGRRLRITGWGGAFTATAITTPSLYVCDGSVATVLAYSQIAIGGAGYNVTAHAIAVVTAAAGAKTYLLGMSNTAAVSTTLTAAANQPTFILVEPI